jgi:hypothetical protein
MKPRLGSTESGESGLIDLFTILIAVGIVAALGFAYLNQRGISRAKSKAQRIHCVGQLKQIGLSFRMWEGDHGGKTPGQVSTNAGGVKELVAVGSVAPYFVALSNELGDTRLLTCPADPGRRAATHFAALADTNISYFVIPEADEALPDLWLSGDRNLATNQVPLPRGFFTMPTNRVMSWTAQLHNLNGNLSLGDGSVQQYSSAKLDQSASIALRAWLATTNAPLRLVIP